jgi:glutaminyl-peptide cyclotransferase
MYCTKSLILAVATGVSLWSADYSGVRALELTRKAVGFGERPSGSVANTQTQKWIVSELKKLRCAVSFDEFSADTPAGPLPMKNIMASFPGTSGRMILVSGHYDTKVMKGFVGANDGGSSTGFLLELAHVLNRAPRKHTVVIVFFDGEEAIHDWTATDSVYGSRHLAAKWEADGTLRKINALINVDMIGDAQLDILRNPTGSQTLTRLIWEIAAAKGYGTSFQDPGLGVEDDHVPFLNFGVNAVDLIDFNYGPGNSYWHTPADTMDKLAPRSFQVVGEVVLETIRKLEQ